MSNQVRPLPPNFTEFEANGNKYVVSKHISAERFKEYEKLVPNLTYGLSFQEIYKQLGKLYNHLNKQSFADAAVICHNIMGGIRQIDDVKRIHPALEMCALVINRENEDTRVYNRELMLAKINDWQEEGLDMMSFFRFALNIIEGFRETLIESTREKLNQLQQEESQSQ